jgi:hypothetical protein
MVGRWQRGRMFVAESNSARRDPFRLTLSAMLRPESTIDVLGVARGPFKATVLPLMLLMASSGITVFPFFKMGVTSTSSHTIGTLAAEKIDLTDSAISAPIPDGQFVFNISRKW